MKFATATFIMRDLLKTTRALEFVRCQNLYPCWPLLDADICCSERIQMPSSTKLRDAVFNWKGAILLKIKEHVKALPRSMASFLPLLPQDELKIIPGLSSTCKVTLPSAWNVIFC